MVFGEERREGARREEAGSVVFLHKTLTPSCVSPHPPSMALSPNTITLGTAVSIQQWGGAHLRNNSVRFGGNAEYNSVGNCVCIYGEGP